MQTGIPSSTDVLFENIYIRADTGKRFLNYLIDLMTFNIIASFFGRLMDTLPPEPAYSLAKTLAGVPSDNRLFNLVLYGFYMSVVEAAFKGKSLGKLITGIRAVNLDGSPISVGTAFSRGYSRALPFCALSAFGDLPNPWQDKWMSTMVIDEKKSRINPA